MTDATRPLSAEEMEERLDEHVDAVLSSRRTAAGPARRLAALERSKQEFVLHWVGAVAQTHSEMAYQVAAYASEALQHMDGEGVEGWVIQAMDAFDKQGLRAGIAVLQGVEAFAHQRAQRLTGLAFEEVSGVLHNLILALNGRSLRLEIGEHCYTDTETLFLPGLLSRFPNREQNFRLFKAIAVHQWAQTWYGTWRLDLAERLPEFAAPHRALALFHALETIRLDACIARELPGVYRDMQALRKALDAEPQLPPGWAPYRARLQAPGARVEDSWDILSAVYDGPVPAPCCYQGMLIPERVDELMSKRQSTEKSAFRVALAKVRDELDTDDAVGVKDQEGEQKTFTLRKVAAQDMPEGFSYTLELGGKPIDPPQEVRGLMASIIQDLGEIPADYLVAAGPGAYHAPAKAEAPDPNEVWKGTYHEQGALLYNEWDYARQHYRKNWCVLRERDVHPQDSGFVRHTLSKYRGLVKSLRRTFEALRGEDKALKKQAYGEDIDIDALVEAYADVQSGLEMTERVFTKMRRIERDIAVMFMVDMSGSTKGWINDAEREALVLLCEALETLGDRYAIYGFSGMTRKRCELFRIKHFGEPYTEEVRARIAGITPQDYTRMGVAIRHLTTQLKAVEARTKLLVTLSDGKPDDYTGYRGEYGIEDTRQALFEARGDGIHPFCITIDEQGEAYLPHMYGAVNYVLIDDVRKLPLKVSDIYRRLTT